MTDSEYIDRYIYEVTRHLPRRQRQQATLELQELIADQAALTGGEDAVRRVLEKLGPPAAYAATLREKEPFFVLLPAWYAGYRFVLTIVLCAVGGGLLLSALMQAVAQPQNLSAVLLSGLSSLFSGLLAAFGGVTVLFLLFQRLHWQPFSGSAAFSPDQLLPVPKPGEKISRSDSVIGVVFSTLFLGLLVVAPQLFGVYVFREKTLTAILPFLNLSAWNTLLPVLVLLFVLSLCDELVKLSIGRYNRTVAVATTVFSLLQTACSAWLFLGLPLLNPAFPQAFGEAFRQDSLSLAAHWQSTLPRVLFFLAVLGTAVEVGHVWYKARRA